MSSNPRSRRKRSDKGISSITVQGYKSLLHESSIEIRPLTLLAGTNSSGKSSIMQPLLLLKQTLEATYDPGPLLLYGPNVKFTSAEQVFARIAGKGSVENFSVELSINGDQSLKSTFEKRAKKGISLAEMIYKRSKEIITIRENMTSKEIRSVLPKSLKDIENILSRERKNGLEWEIERSRCFFAVVLRSEMYRSFLQSSWLTYPDTSSFIDRIRGIIHVPGLRGNPERTYKTTAIGKDFPGTFENYVASVISYWQFTNDSKLHELSNYLEELGLTWKVEAKQIDDTQVELRVGRLLRGTRGGARDTVNIADVGFGVSQTLPILVALLAAQEGQVVYIEQPEIHLHPKAQTIVASLLARASLRGVKVVVETHSSLLLRGVQTLVAQSNLRHDIVKLHWFSRRTEDGSTEINSADLDESGSFGEWPEDFEEVILGSEKAYLDAVESKYLS